MTDAEISEDTKSDRMATKSDGLCHTGILTTMVRKGSRIVVSQVPRVHPASKTSLLFALTLRAPSGGHCVELQFHPSSTHFPSVMTLRGPSGGHCVGLSG